MVIALMAVGCGGSEDSSSGADSATSASSTQAGSGSDSSADDGSTADGASGQTIKTSQLNKAAFLTKANASCSKKKESLLEKLAAYAKQNESKKQPAEVFTANAYKAVLVPMMEAQMAEIRKLGAPAGDEEEIEAMLAAQQATIDEFKEQKTLESTDEFERYFADATQMFRDYGFACTIP